MANNIFMITLKSSKLLKWLSHVTILSQPGSLNVQYYDLYEAVSQLLTGPPALSAHMPHQPTWLLALALFKLKLCLHYGKNHSKLGFFKEKNIFCSLMCTSLERLLP